MAEMILWSIALPGFAQLLNKRYIKGILFILLEIIINVMANFNEIIVLSFLGEIELAIERTNYQWLMFYPCLYFFAMWDAYKDAGGAKNRYTSVPFAFAAYFVTVGLIFSSELRLFGVLLGPMWLPISFVPIGVGIGFLIKWLLIRFSKQKHLEG